MGRAHSPQPLIIPLTAFAVIMAMALTPGRLELAGFMLFYLVVAYSFNMFMGMTGYVDFGFVAFMGLGAYGMALGILVASGLGLNGSLALPLGIALGAALAALLAAVVGLVALRLRGAYFAIATIGVNEGLRYFIEGTGVWGGSSGLLLFGALRNIYGDRVYDVVTVYPVLGLGIVFLISILTTWYILNSKIGYALRAIREDEDAARALGINTTKYKLIAFILSAVFASTAGSLYWGLRLTAVYPPEVFNVAYTVESVVMVVLGGGGTLLGPLVGGLVYALAKLQLATLVPGLHLLFLTPILIALVVLAPGGIIGKVRSRFRSTIVQ